MSNSTKSVYLAFEPLRILCYFAIMAEKGTPTRSRGQQEKRARSRTTPTGLTPTQLHYRLKLSLHALLERDLISIHYTVVCSLVHIHCTVDSPHVWRKHQELQTSVFLHIYAYLCILVICFDHPPPDLYLMWSHAEVFSTAEQP